MSSSIGHAGVSRFMRMKIARLACGDFGFMNAKPRLHLGLRHSRWLEPQLSRVTVFRALRGRGGAYRPAHASGTPDDGVGRGRVGCFDWYQQRKLRFNSLWSGSTITNLQAYRD
jgi:hypothetical protein